MASSKRRDQAMLVAVIGDEDTVTGFLLAGVGQRDAKGTNFLIVDGKTHVSTIEDAFRKFTTREDIGIILINQHIAEEIRHLLNEYESAIPTVLEIPAKDKPYDLSKDNILKRCLRMLGEVPG